MIAPKGTPPEGWTLGHVSLRLIPERLETVEAWRRGAFAVHEPGRGSVRLTHAPTGLLIATFDDLDTAVVGAEAIEPLTDWGAISQKAPPSSDLPAMVTATIERAITAWQNAEAANSNSLASEVDRPQDGGDGAP